MISVLARCSPALLFVTVLLAACARPQPVTEIPSQRAVDIARQHISFQPDDVSAARVMSGTRSVWRVTFRGRLQGQPPGLFETVIVEVDRASGEIVSVARS